MKKYKKRDKAKSNIRIILITIAITTLVISFCILIYCIFISFFDNNKYYSNSYNAEKLSSNNVENESNDESLMIDEVNKAVVGISKIKDKGSTIFLKDATKSLGLGTGFIISSDGYIVSNQHLTGDQNSICYVTTADGLSYKATVKWVDKDLDISILKIKADNLSYLEFGDSNNLKITQNVYAIGNPIGYEFQRTVTSGIISGLDRTIKIEEENNTTYMEDLIQTDATINQGNSGGPLINFQGKVIGITTVKITSADGIGFAVPIDTIKPVVEKLTTKGEYKTPTLGIYAYDKSIIPYINQSLGLNETLDTGLYITNIIKNSPASKVDIKIGDIILKVDNISLEKMKELRKYIYSKNVGDEVTLLIKRSKREFEIKINLSEK